MRQASLNVQRLDNAVDDDYEEDMRVPLRNTDSNSFVDSVRVMFEMLVEITALSGLNLYGHALPGNRWFYSSFGSRFISTITKLEPLPTHVGPGFDPCPGHLHS